jgi:NOL1/NOP2/sun family putative RNA methylase
MNRFLSYRYKALLGDGFESIQKASKMPAPRYIRVNTLRVNEEELKKRLEPKGFVLKKKMDNCFEVVSWKVSPGATTEYMSGYYMLQDWTSMLPALSLCPGNEIVWDMCASPGGKTTHLCELMRNQGILVATDKKNIRALWYNVMRMCCSNVIIYRTDARKIDFQFDKILLDAPCTGTGMMRKDMSRGKITKRDIDYMSNLQKKLVEKAISCLKKGGTLVYSTCSLEPEENEHIVQHALNNGMEIVETGFGDTGISNPFNESLDKRIGKCTRIWPVESSGFFIARMVKK